MWKWYALYVNPECALIFLFSLAMQNAWKTINWKSSVSLNSYHLFSCYLFLPFAFILFNCTVSCKQDASTLLLRRLNTLVEEQSLCWAWVQLVNQSQWTGQCCTLPWGFFSGHSCHLESWELLCLCSLRRGSLNKGCVEMYNFLSIRCCCLAGSLQPSLS